MYNLLLLKCSLVNENGQLSTLQHGMIRKIL